MNIANLIGRRFGILEVTDEISSVGGSLVACKCECGSKIEVSRALLMRGLVRSCGCRTKEKRRDLTGRPLGRMRVVGRVDVEKPGEFWLCACKCGGTIIVERTAIVAGSPTSCGCARPKKLKPPAQPYRMSRNSHRLPIPPEKKTWKGMLSRCGHRGGWNPEYAGRGIVVCERWRNSFDAFYEDMGPKPTPNHSIDRIDNNKGYSPDNCRWATPKEQNRNRRGVRRIEVDGQFYTLSELAEIYGLSRYALNRRIKYGWTIERTLLQPTHKAKKKIQKQSEDRDLRPLETVFPSKKERNSLIRQ